ncbi:4-alpha-glucanotransferase [soil metagenome]
MSPAPTAADLLRAWDIEPGYHDVFGQWREPTTQTATLVRRAMGARTDDPFEAPPPGTDLRIVRPGDRVEVGSATLVLEDGSRQAVDGALPPDVPLGYHRLERPGPDGAPEPTNLIISPGRCVLPPDLRVWGLTVQLYAARSSRSWGIGDLADLRRLVAWGAERGAGVMGLNPLHAPDPLPHPADSPYSPSSRRWRSPLYLAIEEVPGAEALPDRDALVARGRALNHGARIDRTAVWRAKFAALAHLWSQFRGDVRFDAYRTEHGDDLTTWATYCALADHHRSGWRSWPLEHRRPDSPGVAAFAADHDYEVGLWAWLQWLIDEQLVTSGAPEVALADLAVGFDADGADAWQWQDLLAEGVRIGAPPDLLGPDGQDWGLPPFVPRTLRDVAYQPVASTLRAVARHARGLRIDHVMGLFRLLWIPPGMGAAEGAYVRFPGTELLEVVALESVRSGAVVVGEDLGTVETGVREILADAGVLSTRLLWFEEEPPPTWPRQAMSSITTHDLPTVAGVWSGTDLADQRAAGVTVATAGDADMRHRLRVAASCDDTTTVEEVVVGAHRRLGQSPSQIVTAALDDLVRAEHRPNLPGTIDEHPNWRIPLPVAVDELDGHPLAEAVAEALAHGRRPDDGRPGDW